MLETEKYAAAVPETHAWARRLARLGRPVPGLSVRVCDAATERIMRDLDKLWAQAEVAFAGNSVGQETLKKGKMAIEKSKKAIATGQHKELQESIEPLARTLKLIKGSMQKPA